MSNREARSWPAVGHEERPWVSRHEQGSASRTQVRRHRGPYLAALPPHIDSLRVEVSPEALSRATDAANEVARFDAEMGGEIAPFSSVLLRSESAASSQIEDLTASARAIAEAEIGERSRAHAQQIVGNVAAMGAALALSNDLTAQAILDMHQALLAHTEPAIAGRWRHEQVWIGGSSLGPHGAAFVPPHHSHVPAAIDDLVGFVARDDVPVLVHAAIAHAQFETIHPFPDGNGRTGRALMQAMLRGKGLTRNVMVPISAGLLTDVDEYFEALIAYRDGQVDPIVVRLADASYAAISNGRQLVAELREIRRGWDDRVRSRKGTATWRIAELLMRHPVINAVLVQDELGIARPNVYRSLAPLEEAGVLTPSGGQRARVWRSPEVLAAVDAFAKRAGRRRRST